MSRTPTSSLARLSAIAAVLAVALAGCSGNSAPEPPEEGPLTKYLSALTDGQEFTQEQFDQEQLKVEELVAACMQKEGFDYKPNPQNSGGMISRDDDNGPQWGTMDFAKQYGYGIVNSPWQNEEPPTDDYVDLNAAYVNSLNESEQQAYNETLYGPGPTEEQQAEMNEGGSYTSDWTQEGCQGAANHKVRTESNSAGAAFEDPDFADLFASMQEVWSSAYDPTKSTNDDIAKLNAKWADCMADAGYPGYTSSQDATTAIIDAFNELSSAGDPAGDQSAEQTAPPPPNKKDLDALGKREIDTAVADMGCKEKIDFDKQQQKIGFAIEQAFVDEHKTELDALLAKYAATSPAKSQEK